MGLQLTDKSSVSRTAAVLDVKIDTKRVNQKLEIFPKISLTHPKRPSQMDEWDSNRLRIDSISIGDMLWARLITESEVNGNTWSAKLVASASEEKPTPPPAPPRLMVTTLPFAWQASILGARVVQFGSSEPANVALSTLLQVLARFMTGKPPVPKKVLTNATGITSIASSWQ